MIFITIEQLKYFVKLTEYNSFSLASHDLCISQSSLSKHIKALENELNTVLFNRNTRNINLTDAGYEFLIYAKKAIADYNNIIYKLQKYNNNHNKVLNIGCIPVTAQYKITSAISNFTSMYPYIQVNLIETNTSTLLNKVTQSELNFSIVRDFDLSKELFDINYLSDDEIVFVTCKKHPLSKNEFVSLFDIKDENFILLGNSSAIHKKCIYEFNKNNLSLNVINTYSKIETILGLVSENLGCTLLMKKVLNSFNTSNVSIIPIKDSLKINLSLVNNKDKELSDPETLFKDFIINYLK